ncbi:MAG: hypothetical protein ABFR05_04520 [Bacteroidota bacterium]
MSKVKSYLKNLLDNKQHKRTTVTLLILACLLLSVSFVIGIADNPLGIFFLMFGVLALTLAIIHPWRKIKNYMILLVISVVGFMISVLLYNLFYAVTHKFEENTVFFFIFELMHVFFFLLGVLVFPVTAAVGIVGAILFYIRSEKLIP